ITTVRARWAGHRAAASETGSDGAAWLDGPAAAAVTCDALISPVVMGEVDPGALDGLVWLCVELARLGPGTSPGEAAAGGAGMGDADPGDVDMGGADPDGAGPYDAGSGNADPDHADPGKANRQPPATAAGPGSMAREALERAIIGQAVQLLSGPGGLASFLRRQQLGAPLAGPSLPLDIGYSDTVPAAIRHAVTLRDQHCRWSGGCTQPAAACQVHHVRHKANGGPTSAKDCILLCFFHHQVAIHRWGWTLVLNSDGTTTAWNPDRSKVLRSHSPPARAG
ncbi:MAG: HNH endonuclease signature motif containing protein, partial [Streptosporangiaceae bacterium]